MSNIAGAVKVPSSAAKAATVEVDNAVRLVPKTGSPNVGGPDRVRTVSAARPASRGQHATSPGHEKSVRSWPLLVLALPAAVAVWSGWVGIGQLTGFGQVHPLPGIWDSFPSGHRGNPAGRRGGLRRLRPRAWLASSEAVSGRIRRFARWSAIGSLLLGMAGQVAYHLLAQVRATHAPWGITTAVSCLPVLVLGMGVALAHMLRADSHSQGQPGEQGAVGTDRSGPLGPPRHLRGPSCAHHPAGPAG